MLDQCTTTVEAALSAEKAKFHLHSAELRILIVKIQSLTDPLDPCLTITADFEVLRLRECCNVHSTVDRWVGVLPGVPGYPAHEPHTLPRRHPTTA